MSKMRLNPALERLTPFSYCGTGYPVRLDANESCVPLSAEIRGELAAAVGNLNLNCYPDDCTVALREAFGRAFSVDPECVVPGNGSDELINMIVGRLIPYQGLVLESNGISAAIGATPRSSGGGRCGCPAKRT